MVCRVIAYLREQEQIASDISGTRLEGRKQQFVLCNNRGIGQRIIEVPTINLRDRIFIDNSLSITGIRPCSHIVCSPIINGVIKQDTFSVFHIGILEVFRRNHNVPLGINSLTRSVTGHHYPCLVCHRQLGGRVSQTRIQHNQTKGQNAI